MNRLLTILMFFVAVGLAVSVIVLRSCTGPDRDDGFMLSLTPRSVEKISIHSGNDELELRRKGSGWQVVAEKLKDRANDALVEKILDAAATLIYYDKIAAREISHRDDLSEFGVRSPKRWVEFTGPSKRKILFGKEAAHENRIYARLDGANAVYVIDDTLTRMLDIPLQEFRDRRLSDIPADQVDRIVITNVGIGMELSRTPVGWQITKPLVAPADSTAVLKYLTDILNTQVSAFVTDDSGDLGSYGIEEGNYQVALFVEGRERPVVLRFGVLPSDAPGSIMAQFTGRDMIVRVPEATRKVISVTPDQLRDRHLLPINIDTVDLIRIQDPAAAIELRRDGEGWTVSNSTGKHAASDAALHRLVEGLASVEATSFHPDPVPDNPANRTIRFYSVLTENTPEDTVGEHLIASVTFAAPTSGQVAASVKGQGGTLVVPEDVLKLIPTDPAAWRLPVSGK